MIDLQKLREAIKVQDGQVEEKEGKAEEKKDLMEGFDVNTMSEDEFLEKAIGKIGELQKTKNKTLTKDTFIKVFKMTGEFAKLRSKEIKKHGQSKRMEFFGVDPKKYLEAIKGVIAEEEKSYEDSSQVMFEKLCITPECFERTQQELMMDPMASMELFNMGIGMESPVEQPPADLDASKTRELVKGSNDYAFNYFKKEFMD